MELAFFGLSITSSWGNGHANTYRSLLRGLHERGHKIRFYEKDVEWYGSHRDLNEASYAEIILYRDWAEAREAGIRAQREADAIIVGSYFPDAILLMQELLGRRGAPLAFYDIDTPVTLADLKQHRCRYLRREFIPECDLYLSFTGGPVLEELKSAWGAQRVHPLYCACDAAWIRAGHKHRGHEPGEALDWSADLGYMGTFAPDRQAKFERFLLEPARRHDKRRFKVAGPLFPAVEDWPRNVHYQHHLAPGDHAGFYGSCRLTLNLTRQAMTEAGYSPSIRLFEAAACGTAIVSDAWPGLAEFFLPEAEILVATEGSDIGGYLENVSPQQARAIGEAARAKVMQAHTGAHRAQELEAYLSEVV